MTPNKAKMILNKIAHCRTDNCPDDECAECDYGVTEDDCNEAIETAITALENFMTQMSGTSDLVSRQYLLDEYDRQHQGPPGGARKIIEEAPAVEVLNNPTNNPEIPNSSDLISRQDALDIVDDLNSPDWYMEWGAEARRRLVDLPAMQPKQKTGHWIEHKTQIADHTVYTYECSECGNSMLVKPTRFCGHCGLKMEEVNDDPE